MLFVSLEHIEVFLVIFSETFETGHVGFPENWVIWREMTHHVHVVLTSRTIPSNLSMSMTRQPCRSQRHVQ